MKTQYSFNIQCYIRTLNENYVNVTDKKGNYSFPGFDLLNIHFEPFSFTFASGHIESAWIASGEVRARSAQRAYIKFRRKIDEVVEKISFVGQAFITASDMPFLIIREDGIMLFRYIFEDEPSPLMYMEGQHTALKLLMSNKTIPRNFYRYWNQAVNSSNYFGKLAMMFSAVDSFKLPNGEVDITMREKIFDPSLKKRLYQKNNKGLRHRIVHGLGVEEYEGKIYWHQIHRAVIKWFNDSILPGATLNMNIVDPQRNFQGNHMGAWILLRQKSRDDDIKSLLKCCHGSEVREVYEKYESIHDDPSPRSFWGER